MENAVSNNLHISYDLYAPGQNYEKLIAKIKMLGGWAKIHKSFWYVKSALSAEQARNALVPMLDQNDSLYVVDATNNMAAWHNISEAAADYIRESWLARAA